jgi:hypothetical protein
MLAGIIVFLNFFKKKIFAALCSKMSKGPLLRKEKKELFSRLNDAVKKAGPKKLKVRLGSYLYLDWSAK